ncbi:MAG: 5,6-dimethylbenzimidazole synthase [Gammaproteobacteria bacterium]|nr:5,6-dimethylbenzimidazole synthase [Gammaproteobacteria bacterium]
MSRQQSKFSDADRDAIYRVIKERRDMRHFRSDPVDSVVLERLLNAAHQAPSVGLMQPWRIIRITDIELRTAIKKQVDIERIKTAEALDERQQEFMRLKVEGITDCGELLVVTLMNDREQHIFGRRTMPEMDLASVACAIQNMWLASRAEGLGMGWVSLFEPDELAELLAIPDGARPVAILCLGHVDEFYPAPMLESEGWRQGISLDQVLFENTWGNDPS